MNVQKVGHIWVDLDELKERVDLTEMYGAGKVLCPWHTDHTPSLHVYPDHVYCFSCGATADAVGFVGKVENLGFSDAVALLRARQGSFRARPKPATPVDRADVEEYHQALMRMDVGDDAWQWLINRGLSVPIVTALTIGWTGRAIAIPHFANGQVHNIKFRVLPVYQRTGEPKYVSLPHKGFPFLYPWDYFRHHYSDSPRLFVTEGEFDAMLLLSSGLPAVSIPSGVSTPWAQWVPFFRRFRNIYVLYDMDAPGIAAARKLVEDTGKIGKSMVQMLEPTVVRRVTWDPETHGKDVTEARRLLLPGLLGCG